MERERACAVHLTRGRLRIKGAAVKGSRARATAAERRLTKVHGVHRATADPTTGSILILFDSSATNADALLDAAAASGCLPAVPPSRMESRWADTIAAMCVNHLIERMLLAIL